jgi:hypothetical protein
MPLTHKEKYRAIRQILQRRSKLRPAVFFIFHEHLTQIANYGKNDNQQRADHPYEKKRDKNFGQQVD